MAPVYVRVPESLAGPMNEDHSARTLVIMFGNRPAVHIHTHMAVVWGQQWWPAMTHGSCLVVA